MPVTNYLCPGCRGLLHTDDLMEGRCITNDCGAMFDTGVGPRDDLPRNVQTNANDDSDNDREIIL